MSDDSTEKARWPEVCAAFDQLMQLETSARKAALDRIEDSELRELVAALMPWHDEAHEVLTPNLFGIVPSDALESPDAELLPRTLGRYRLLRILGRGGMGVVYLGERTDGEYSQQVAIKLLPRGLGSGELVHRFRVERQILAGLDHPGIAKLLDGGTTEDGLPFLVMELVEGERIDRYCTDRRLGVEERLRLFLRVCAAVQHAHRHLVVHRDLKPSNILVRHDGELKLLDFGIAKLLSPSQLAEVTVATINDQRPMTPEYASPEQLAGEAITTASDVYSLGILLYELLTGSRPSQVPERTPEAAVRVVRDVNPARPSQAVSARDRRLAARLAGDLDTIVLMALRREPERRYSSVDELARDLERHLAGLPVHARGESAWYLTRKFAQRHRWRLAIAAVSLGVLVTLGLSLARQSSEARRQRESAADLAKFLEDVFLASDPRATKGKPFDQRTILARGINEIESRLDDQPLVKAQLIDTVGRVYLQLGAYEEAKHCYRQALDLRRAERHPSAELVAASLQHLAGAYARLEELPEAETLLREALELCNQPSLREHPGRIFVLAELGAALRRMGRPLEAEPYLVDAMEQARRNLARPNDPRLFDDNASLAAQAARRLATNRQALGRFDEAEALLREALGWYRQVHEPPHPYIATAALELGSLLAVTGDRTEAETLLREVLAMQRTLFGERHPEHVATLSALGQLLAATGRAAEARAVREQALDLAEEFFGADHARARRIREELAAMSPASNLDKRASPFVPTRSRRLSP